jgi:uncharacterized secreted protein with C-terminal beta-propeller domain
MSRHARARRSSRPLFEELESRSLPSGNPVWTVIGDRQPGDADDTIVIQRNPLNANVLQAVVNGEVISTHRLAGLARLRVYAGTGDDVVSVNVGNAASSFVVVVRGGRGNDELVGTNGRDDLRGGMGDDVLDGAGGRDWLRGGLGADRLHGGLGADSFDGGTGHTTFYGYETPEEIVRLGDDATFLAANANPLHRIASVDELREWVARNAASTWAGWFGQPGGPVWSRDPGWGGIPAPAPGAVNGGGGAGGVDVPGAPVSVTNTQEDGVDEADILKTDGEYLYAVVGNELLVIDARVPDSLAITGRVTIDGSVQAIYLTGDRVVALSHGYEYDQPTDWPRGLPINGGAAASLWWGYAYRSQTIVTTIDVTDRTAPTVAHQTTLDGWLVDSRAVNGRVYTVVQNDLSFPQPLLIDTQRGPVYESEAQYRARLDADLLGTLPTYTTADFGAGGTAGEGSLVEGDVYLPTTVVGQQLVSVAVFDPAADAPGPVAVTTVAGASGEVYASQDSLYIAATDYSSPWRGGGETTQLYKFALQSDAVPLDALGSVDGTVLNQFSMDEEGGFFRIATTSGWGVSATNAVYVMADTGAELDVVGAIEDLGQTETIHAVRFEGDAGYVVTFRQIDPLFTLDLSDPTAPAVVGELKIPGYSSYLQSVGEGRLIGLGRDADPETGAVGGLQISLFDVSDPAHPAQLDVLSFSSEAWGGFSDAEWDHHAISWFADVGILALPVSIDWEHPAALEVLGVGTGGIELLGEIAHGSPVLRSLRIGDMLFSMSAGEIQAHSLTDPSVQIGRVELPATSQPPVVGTIA